jgi:mono/diheme cytochrome c family protein
MKYLVAFLAVAVLVVAGGSLYAAHSDHGCSNCHMPHKSGDPNDPTKFGVPLWSNEQNSDGLPVFDLYSSQSFDALGTDIGQPDGASKMCLGCHDGSYHVFAFIGTRAVFEPGDLARTHPISFTYDAGLVAKTNGGLKDPSEDSGLGGSIAQILLDEKSKMQCSSCHDVHTTGKPGTSDPNADGYLLRFEMWEQDGGKSMCRTCHNK